MKIITTVLALVFSLSIFAQTLSHDFNSPTPLSVKQECELSEFNLGNEISNELGEPSCNRYYQNFNRYISLSVPESGGLNFVANFKNSADFGMAFYAMKESVWTEVRCSFYRDSNGVLRIIETDDLAGQNVLLRIWITDSNNRDKIEICAYEDNEPIDVAKLITVNNTTYTVSQLVTDVLVTGCLEASNVTFQGANNAIGYFNNAIPGLDFEEGIIMSTGNIFDAPGPNNSGGTSTSNYSGSDPHLQALLPSYIINDATVLEFDFIPASNQLEFQYVFGSEEYPEFVNSDYNDVFAFFLSGPNPNGGNYNNTNVALIPGTNIP
ncbi:MAG: hypothetical protein GX879_11140, partial [Bacteroidales bacterium]|nr:hypothetical protein [Bacteroidales bacterium]